MNYRHTFWRASLLTNFCMRDFHEQLTLSELWASQDILLMDSPVLMEGSWLRQCFVVARGEASVRHDQMFL